MLPQEARWLGREIHGRPADQVFPLLNVGSSTGHFRQDEQPWIDRQLFAPARHHGRAVTHLDLKAEAGVDLVGDLTDDGFLERVARMHFRSVLCSNLLEHVTDREKVAARLTALLVPGGLLFVSCPFRYPFHPDPIDTRFRPTVAELAALFPGTLLETGVVLRCETMLTFAVRDALRHPGRTLRGIGRRFGLVAPEPPRPPGPRHENWLPWAFTSLQATCVVLRKPA